MKRRGDEKDEPLQMARRGDTPRSQDTARRTLSDRLESLAADPKDVDAELIKYELEKIASGDELPQTHGKPDLAAPGKKPEENIAASEPVLNSELKLEQDQPPKKLETADHVPAESSSAESHVAHASAATEDPETEESEPTDNPAQPILIPTENLVNDWMGEEIGAPRPSMMGASEIPSRNADISINSDFSAMPAAHDYQPLSTGESPMSADHDESGSETALIHTPENNDAPVDLRDGMSESYPELRSLREPLQDSMLGFYVALAVVFIGSTLGTLYILNQLDSPDDTVSIDQTIVAPASATQSSTTVSIKPTEDAATQFMAAATETGSKTTEAITSENEEHPLLAALNKTAMAKSAAPADSGSGATESSSKFSVDKISGRAGTPLAINVTLPAEPFGKEAYIVFRGLPENLSLSKGEKRDESSWRVPMSQLGDLALNTPQSYSGSFILEVILIRGEDSAPETRIAAVDIASAVAKSEETPAKPPVEEASSTRVASLGSENNTAAKPADVTAPGQSTKEISERTEHEVRTLSESQEISMLSRGGSLLDNGDISGARLLFEYLAQQGSALGAVAYAKTYDPNLFEKGYVKGPLPSADEALKWYGRAVELGNKEALKRLNYLRSQQKVN